jgi:hypothetical protein
LEPASDDDVVEGVVAVVAVVAVAVAVVLLAVGVVLDFFTIELKSIGFPSLS